MSDGTIDPCKKLLKSLGLKAKDFTLKCTSHRRYPGAMNAWYEIQFENMVVDGGDPISGGMTTDMRYWYILMAIFEMASALREYQERSNIENSWDFARSLTENDYAPMRDIWNRVTSSATPS